MQKNNFIAPEPVQTSLIKPAVQKQQPTFMTTNDEEMKEPEKNQWHAAAFGEQYQPAEDQNEDDSSSSSSDEE